MLHLATEPSKNRLLQLIREQERTVTEMVEASGLEQSNVSHQLRQLRKAGLVKARRDGRQRRYRLADPELRHLLGDIERLSTRMERVAYLANLDIHVDPAFHGYG